jgi:hypothetical protein
MPHPSASCSFPHEVLTDAMLVEQIDRFVSRKTRSCPWQPIHYHIVPSPAHSEGLRLQEEPSREASSPESRCSQQYTTSFCETNTRGLSSCISGELRHRKSLSVNRRGQTASSIRAGEHKANCLLQHCTSVTRFACGCLLQKRVRKWESIFLEDGRYAK